MANHKWDKPHSKVSSKCKKCGVSRFAVSARFGKWEYIYPNGYSTLKRPDCNK